MIPRAFELSEKYAVPVLLRPTTRVCHARQPIPLYAIPTLKKGHFRPQPFTLGRNPGFSLPPAQGTEPEARADGRRKSGPQGLEGRPEKQPLAILASGVPTPWPTMYCWIKKWSGRSAIQGGPALPPADQGFKKISEAV